MSFSFLHCHLKSTEWPYTSLLKIGLHDCQQLIIVPFFFLEGKVCLALEDSKKSLGCHHVFLIKFSYGPGTRKPFAWKVMLSVLSLLIMHDFLLSSIALWSSFASVCKHYLSLSNTKSDTFFYWPS